MKILLPYISRNNQDIKSKIITGGLEKFTQLIYELFSENIIPVQITPEQRKAKQTKKIFLDAVNRYKPDIILINDINSYLILPHLQQSIPTICFIHVPLIGNIRYLQMFEDMHKFLDNKGHIYFVSENQLNFLNDFSKRINGRIFEPTGFINPSYTANKYIQENKIYDCITIGRTDLLKDPFIIHKKLNNTNINSCVVTDKDMIFHSDKEEKYAEKNNHWIEPRFTFRGISYLDTMRKLSQSKVYISTCPNECWGITVLEALSYGVPCILLTDKTGNHSSEDIAADPSHIIKLRKTCSTEDLLEAINKLSNITDDERLDIALQTQKKHSKEKFKKTFENIFQNRLSDKIETNNLMSLL